MRGVISTLIILGCVAACAPIHWQREDGVAGAPERAQFNVDNAVCRQAAQGGSAWAVGSAPLVAAWMAGSAVGGGIHSRETYRECMIQQGYVEQ